jgi:hypothetical protein
LSNLLPNTPAAANPLWKMTLAQLAVTQCPDRFPLSATFSSILDFGRDAIVGSPIWNVASAGDAAAWDIASECVQADEESGAGLASCAKRRLQRERGAYPAAPNVLQPERSGIAGENCS